MFVSSMSIENLRCFERAEVTLEHPDAASTSSTKRIDNVTLLLGNNGAGKTTILKAVALAVLAPVIQDAGYKPHYLIRRTREPDPKRISKAGVSLMLHGQDKDESETFSRATTGEHAEARIKTRGDYENITALRSTKLDEHKLLLAQLFEDDSPAYFLVGYGATRRVASPNSSEVFNDKSRGLRYQRVASLFEDYVALLPMKIWLPGLDSQRREAAIGLLNKLLPNDIRFDGDFDDLQPVFTHRGVNLPFTALSDGYRGYIGMVADMLFHLNHVCPQDRKLIDLTGVVLIDDVDLHLHPSWQRTVVPKLAATLPRLQFIVTSHSPLVAATLYAWNIRIIDSPPDGPSHVSKVDERIHGLNADQVLTSSYFGMPSSRAEDQVKKLANMADDVARRGSPEASIAFLKELSGKTPE
jgi:predicted ATP-binding protein involved in virulence